MRLLPSRSFLAGMLAGFILTLIFAGIAVVSLPSWYKPIMTDSIQNKLKPPPVPLNEPADYGWNVRDAAGIVQSMEQYRGKPLLLVFWDPDCAACMAEMESLNRCFEQVADTPLAFLAVAFTGGKAYEAARAEKALIFPTAVLEGKRPAVFDSPAMPSAYVVNSAGKVVFKHLGPAKWDDPASVAFLRALAAGA